jgi:hypothetical protein
MNEDRTCTGDGSNLTQASSGDVHGWTYFIRDAVGIKIGHSIHPRGRMRDLQAGNGSELTLLLAVPSDRLSESEAHQKFRHLKTHREWFRPEQELLDFIDFLKAEKRRPAQPSSKTRAAIGKLYIARRQRGANTPMGHCLSLLAVQTRNMETYVRPAWATHHTQTLPWAMEMTMKRIEELKALDN